MITAASSPISNVIIKQPVKLILQGHTHGAGLVWKDYGAGFRFTPTRVGTTRR
jgi:predicted MPP superfamily phosphohydrolase